MYRPPKIADEGLEKYLDRTADKHNGLYYTDFVRMLQAKNGQPISTSSIAALFGVDRRTIHKWVEIYKAEQTA